MPGAPAPPRPGAGGRRAQAVSEARRLLHERGSAGLTMRALADRVGIRAPSLYKHLRGRPAIEEALGQAGWTELGLLLRTAAGVGGGGGRRRLLAAYRGAALAEPALYRLATSAAGAAPELREWAIEPFRRLSGDPSGGLALWALAHGLALLELDGLLGAGADAAWTAASAEPGEAAPA